MTPLRAWWSMRWLGRQPERQGWRMLSVMWQHETEQARARAKDPRWVSSTRHAAGVMQQRALVRCRPLIESLLASGAVNRRGLQEACEELRHLILAWDAGADGRADEDGFGAGTLRAVAAGVERALECFPSAPSGPLT